MNKLVLYVLLVLAFAAVLWVIGPFLPQDWALPLKHFLREFLRHIT